MKFKNTQNGYIEKTSCPWLWCLLFGWMYFAYKGAWSYAVLWLVTVIVTFGLASIVWLFFAKRAIAKSYLKRGWVQVDG